MIRFVACLAVTLSCATAFAEKGADLKTQLTKPGGVALQEDFTGKELGKAWVQNKGEWTITDGSVVGREKKDDMHAAVLTLQQPFHNTAMKYSFKIDGATGVNLSFNHAKGHLFRIALSESGLTITKDKDKKDAASKPVVLARSQGRIPSGQWHTLLVEVQGDKVLVQTDGGVKLEARDPSLDVDKTGYRFVMRGATLALDDLSIWRVEQ